MNDDIEKINEQNRKLNESSPGDQSQARFSSIKTNEEDKKRSIAEGIIQDLGNQRTDIDATKLAIQQIAQQLNQITLALNQSAKPIQQGEKLQPGQGLNMESISLIGDLIEKAAAAYKSLKGNNIPTDDFTAQIVERSKAEAMESLDIVGLINKSVKKKLVNDIAGDIVHNVSNTSKQSNIDTHAPQ